MEGLQITTTNIKDFNTKSPGSQGFSTYEDILLDFDDEEQEVNDFLDDLDIVKVNIDLHLKDQRCKFKNSSQSLQKLLGLKANGSEKSSLLVRR